MAETVYMGTDEIRLGGGKFSTKKRYIRGSSSPTMQLPKGRTLYIAIEPTLIVKAWRYPVGSYVVAWTLSGQTALTDTAPTQGVVI